MKKKAIINSFFSVFIVLTAYILCRIIKQSPSLPKVTEVLSSAVTIFSSSGLYINALYTAKIVFIGVLVSLILGFIIAVACSMNDVANAMIMPIINCTKNIPSITLFPLFIVLMGIGDLPRISIIIWNSIYPIISSTMLGLNSVEREIEEAGWNCGATKFQMYFYIKIPLALLDVLNGLKISLSNGFIAIVVAEMLGATKGLGYMVLWSANAFQYPDMYVYILVIALIGFSINVVIEKLIKKVERKVYYENRKVGFFQNCINFAHRNPVCVGCHRIILSIGMLGKRGSDRRA